MMLWWCFDGSFRIVNYRSARLAIQQAWMKLSHAESFWKLFPSPFMSLPLFGTGELTFDLEDLLSSNIQARALRFWTVEACRIQALLWWCFDGCFRIVYRSARLAIHRLGWSWVMLSRSESCSLHVPTIVWYRWADIWPSVFESSGQSFAILNSRGL